MSLREKMSEDANVDQLLRLHDRIVGRPAVLDWVDDMLSITTDAVCADDGRTGMCEIRPERLIPKFGGWDTLKARCVWGRSDSVTERRTASAPALFVHIWPVWLSGQHRRRELYIIVGLARYIHHKYD